MIVVIIILLVGFLILMYNIRSEKKEIPSSRHATQEELQHAVERVKREDTQKTITQQKALEDKFFNSPLTRKIIETISDGTGRLPEEITIYDDHVTGRTNGQMRTFDFAANRVPIFDRIFECTGETDREDLILRPQLTLGKAINCILNEQYNVYDKASRESSSWTDLDGEIHFTHYYTSNHVLLRLKATNQW